MRTTIARYVVLFLLTALASLSGVRATAQDDAWHAIRAAFDDTFEPQDAAALGGILESEREVWARVVMILNALGRAKSQGSGPFVLGALADQAWPVRLAAVARTIRCQGKTYGTQAARQ